MTRDVQLEGDLISTPIEAVLTSLHAGRVTGTLWLDGGGFSKRLFLENGRLIATASSDPREFLGAYLVDWGLVSATELDHLVSLQDRYHTLVGELMVRIGAIEREVLDRVLHVVVREVALSTFLWRAGRYRFELCQLPGSSLRRVEVPLDQVVAEGLRRRARWPEMRETVASPRLRPRLVRARGLELLGPSEAEILRHCDGERPVSELPRVCHQPVFAVWDAVSHAASQGVVELLPARTDDSDEAPEGTFGTVHSLATRVEDCLERDELGAAVAAIALLARRFCAAADIDVVVDALRGRVAAALERVLGGDEEVVTLGSGSLGAASDGPVDQMTIRLVELAEACPSVSQLVAAAGGDQLVVRVALADLVRRGVLETHPPGI